MIYLDYNASTPLADTVREAMLPFLGPRFGNASSGHGMGKPLREAVDKARRQVAELLNASPTEIIFNSGGTEGCNHVIKGVAAALRQRGQHIITTAMEHAAIINPCKFLERDGFEITYVEVDSTGRVDPQAIAYEVRPDTILISVMHANNEVGTIQAIAEIADIAREGGVLMHTDAAQSCGKIETRVDRLGVDFLTIAGHKLYGPAGIGAMYVRKGAAIEPLHHGAGHQDDRRSGVEPVALIVGLGAAAELARNHDGAVKMVTLRDRLYEGLRSKLGDDLVLLGHHTNRLPNTLCVGFKNRISADVLAACTDVCASAGAACHTGKRERSATLAAMNIPEEVAFGSIRFSVGRPTTQQEIDEAIPKIVAAVKARHAP